MKVSDPMSEAERRRRQQDREDQQLLAYHRLRFYAVFLPQLCAADRLIVKTVRGRYSVRRWPLRAFPEPSRSASDGVSSFPVA